ncbi:MAG: regulatory protein, tetR family [Ignavibacteria bacterium]|nr:regulatory protein, tetR family [Ignavibacteria bacterium]
MGKISSDARKKQITEQAVEIIHRIGFSGCSIRTISGEIGISEAAIYKHFESKEQIIISIFSQLESKFEPLESELSKIKDSKKKLEKFILFHLQLIEDNPRLSSLLFSEEIFKEHEVVSNKLKTLMKHRHRLLLSIISEAMSSGIMKKLDKEIVIGMIQGFIRHTILRWKLGGYAFSLTKTGRQFLLIINKILFRENLKITNCHSCDYRHTFPERFRGFLHSKQ